MDRSLEKMTKGAIRKMLNKTKDKLPDMLEEEVCRTFGVKKRRKQLDKHLTKSKLKNAKFTKAKNKAAKASTSEEVKVSKASKPLEELCQMMVDVNIPWRCLNNKLFKNFLSQYRKYNIPDELKIYLNNCYESAIKDIRSDIGDNYVWISLSETVDKIDRCIINLVIGKLTETGPSKPHLLSCKVQENINVGSIVRFVNKTLEKLWSNNNKEKVLLLVTDATPHMLRVGEHLNEIFYPKMIHLSCLVQAFDKVAEVLRYECSLVNGLTLYMKEIFPGALNRMQVYRLQLQEMPFPPDPILSRWGAWLEVAAFYAANYNAVEKVIMSLDPKEAISIQRVQDLCRTENFAAHINIIYQFIPIAESMKRLRTENFTMELTNSINLVNGVDTELQRMGYEKLQTIWQDALTRNPGLQKINEIVDISNGKCVNADPNGIISLWEKFKYAPITVCDVERSFSAYKSILSEESLGEDFEEIMIAYCNTSCD